MDLAEVTATEDLWTPYKELVAVVEGYLTREGSGPPYAVHTFEAVLRWHKQTFLSLLKNPIKMSEIEKTDHRYECNICGILPVFHHCSIRPAHGSDTSYDDLNGLMLLRSPSRESVQGRRWHNTIK